MSDSRIALNDHHGVKVVNFMAALGIALATNTCLGVVGLRPWIHLFWVCFRLLALGSSMVVPMVRPNRLP